jgi:hypothetical protein
MWYEENVLHSSTTSGDLRYGAASSQAGLDAGRDASLYRGTLAGGSQKLIGK